MNAMTRTGAATLSEKTVEHFPSFATLSPAQAADVATYGESQANRGMVAGAVIASLAIGSALIFLWPKKA